ncbi:guanylate kinase [bacterium]|nr:guanylate kinase [bacterium]
MKRGRLIVISAPSGSGKTTICDRLLKRDKKIVRSISATTRERRGRERHGRDYYYRDKAVFKRDIQAGKFLEWAEVHGHYYGTLKQEVARQRKLGKDVALVIDVQGGLTVRRLDPEAVLIFIQPPSFQVLEKRLRFRGTDDRGTIAQRLKNARWEMKFVKDYDYSVVNNRLEEAVAQIKAILIAERLRVSVKRRTRKK